MFSFKVSNLNNLILNFVDVFPVRFNFLEKLRNKFFKVIISTEDVISVSILEYYITSVELKS